MAAPYEPPFRPGAFPGAAEMNAFAGMLYQAGLVGGEAFGEIGVAQGLGGVQLLDGTEKSHWAKIGARGAGANYAHTPVAAVGDGTFTDIPDTPATYWGTATDRPAREVNGSEDVPEGAYARLYPDPVNGWLFQFATTAADSPAPLSNCLAAFVGWPDSACLTVTVLQGADPGQCANVDYQLLDATATAAGWTSAETFPVPGGDAIVVIYRKADGSPGAEISVWTGAGFESVEGVYVGCAGGALEFAFPADPLLCDDTAVECGDNTVRVRAECTPCTPATPVDSCDVGECPDGAPGAYTFPLAGGTADFAGANGDWTVVLDDTTDEWASTPVGGWTATYFRTGTTATLRLDFGPITSGLFLEYQVDPVDADCCAAVELTLIDSGGAGSAPASPTLTAVGDCGPCPSVSVTCCPDDLLFETYNLTFGGALSGLGTTPITWNGVAWVSATDFGDWCGNSANKVTATVQCTAGSPPWSIAFTVTGPPVTATGDSSAATSCAPLAISFNGTADCGAWTAVVTE